MSVTQPSSGTLPVQAQARTLRFAAVFSDKDIRADMIQRQTPTRGESIADKNARLLAAAAAADRQETPA